MQPGAFAKIDAAINCLGKQSTKREVPLKCSDKEYAALNEMIEVLESSADKSKAVHPKVMRAFKSLAAKTEMPQNMKVSDAVFEKFIENFKNKAIVMQSGAPMPSEYCTKWSSVFPKYGADMNADQIIA